MNEYANVDEVRWGIIGCGDVAEHKSGPALYAVDRSRLVSVMSRNEDRARSFARRHGAARFYTNAEDLIRDEEVNAVYIATPPALHAEFTIRAAEASKHVLCEKPMAMSAAECEQMIEACRNNRVQLMIAYYRRFFPVVEKIKSLLDAEVIGRPLTARAMTADYLRNEILTHRGWLVDPAISGGGFLTDVATHRLDLFSHLFGRVREVAAFVDTQHLDIQVDDASSLLLRFENGMHATGVFNWNIGTGVDEFEVCGTKGRIVSRHLGRGLLDIITEDGIETLELPAPAVTHLGLVKHYVDCLLTGKPNKLPGEEGMQATRITDAAYQSARTGQSVSLA